MTPKQHMQVLHYRYYCLIATNAQRDSHCRGRVLVVPSIHLLLVFQPQCLECVHVLNVFQSGPKVLYHIAHQRLDVLLCRQ